MDQPSDITAKRIRVAGRVQGVYFRVSARRLANSLDLKGWAHNEANGSVSIHIEGAASAIDEFVRWCQTGPDDAVVESAEIVDVEPIDASTFETG